MGTLGKILAFIGGLTVSMMIFGSIVALVLFMTEKPLPEKIVLELDFQKGVTEVSRDDPMSLVISDSSPTVRRVVDALDRASRDDRVQALVARVGRGGMGMAQIQEMRDAVLSFREKGKTAIAYTETFGEFGPGNGTYYLATAFDEIHLQPSGDLGLTGLMSETAFFRGALDKLGVIPRLDHREEYKNIMNIFTEEKYTAAHREAVQRILDSLFGQIVQGISQERNLSEEEVRNLIDQGPFSAQQTVDVGLVDDLSYRDEVYTRTRETFGKDAEFMGLMKYSSRASRESEKEETVALIFGVGEIARGRSKTNPLSGNSTMGSDTVTKAFRQAIKDKDVKAILFRVDSPGGSYVASDSVWSEVARAKEAGKPVIVSMGNVAGSGGYFVSMAAEKIVAQPATITGSIGVVAGKMLLSGFWNKLGVTWDEAHTSANSTVWSYNEDYTPKQWTRFQEWLDEVYADFVAKAARGRELTNEEIMKVAKGQIWTGKEAQKLGLVDALGGFPTALKLLREAAEIPEDTEIRLKTFPKKKSPLERLAQRLLGEGERNSGTGAMDALNETMQMIRPVTEMARELGLLPHPGVLTMAPIGAIR
jgi:protease-4